MWGLGAPTFMQWEIYVLLLTPPQNLTRNGLLLARSLPNSSQLIYFHMCVMYYILTIRQRKENVIKKIRENNIYSTTLFWEKKNPQVSRLLSSNLCCSRVQHNLKFPRKFFIKVPNGSEAEPIQPCPGTGGHGTGWFTSFLLSMLLGEDGQDRSGVVSADRTQSSIHNRTDLSSPFFCWVTRNIYAILFKSDFRLSSSRPVS